MRHVSQKKIKYYFFSRYQCKVSINLLLSKDSGRKRGSPSEEGPVVEIYESSACVSYDEKRDLRLTVITDRIPSQSIMPDDVAKVL